MSKVVKNNFFILTGSPGSGKTSILRELQSLGYLVVPEYAREIIREQRIIDGEGVYDRDPRLFKELMLSRAIHDYEQHSIHLCPVIFDRGIPDILVYADCFGLERGSESNAASNFQYNNTVFFSPSWREIYANDEDRKISYEEAQQFGNNLEATYLECGYQVVRLPLVSPLERATFIIDKLGTTL
ncbi:MAG: ATPase [Legionellaceae bacterium]|nr:ATPase [Legionellaceae bacterium]